MAHGVWIIRTTIKPTTKEGDTVDCMLLWQPMEPDPLSDLYSLLQMLVQVTNHLHKFVEKRPKIKHEVTLATGNSYRHFGEYLYRLDIDYFVLDCYFCT